MRLQGMLYGYLKEEDVKQAIKELKEFIKDKTLSKKGLPKRVVFMAFEFKEFLETKIGKELCSEKEVNEE